MNKVNIGWYKLNKAAIIPTKTDNNAGFDIYTIEEEFTLAPHTQHLFSTGLAAVVDKGWWLMACDRGSTGSKGIHIHCGVVDNNYRGEIFICLNNDHSYPIKFTDKEAAGLHTHTEQITTSPLPKNGITLSVAQIQQVEVVDYLVYPISKAIAQLVLIPQPVVNSYEIKADEWEQVKDTDRGDGKLGSSGK